MRKARFVFSFEILLLQIIFFFNTPKTAVWVGTFAGHWPSNPEYVFTVIFQDKKVEKGRHIHIPL